MADETRVTGSSLTSFDDAARAAFGMVRGDPSSEGSKAAEIRRAWMTGGGFVGVPQYHVELRVLRRPGSAAAAAGDLPWSSEGWTAYHDSQPISPPTLRVHGTCTAPTNGYSFALVRATPQGINPGDLLLELIVCESDFANEVVTTYDVHYAEETEMRYDTVSIVPYGPAGVRVEPIQ